MTRRDYRALLLGVGLLAASMLLLELLAFRLVAATLGFEVGMLVGFGQPAVAGLGAMVVARKPAETRGAALCAAAAHFTALAGAAVVAGGIGITWVSQQYATDEAAGWHLAVALGLLLLPALFAGAAMGLSVRRGIRVIGRLGFVEAIGAVLGCALVPAAMWAGAPRSILALGMIFALAAFALAAAGRAAEPQWPVIATLPLAVIALVVGDLGDPWLDVRTDQGRRTSIQHWEWTAQGLIGAEKIERGESSLRIDRKVEVPFAKKRPAAQKPRFDAVDLGYLVEGLESEKGPVLVVGSGGAREIDVALAYGHPRVDALELHAALFDVLALERYAAITGHVLSDGERVRLRIGDGRAALRDLPRDYQHIIVLEASRFDQSSPRLLARHDRLFTRQAVAAYLGHLRDDGTLLFRVPKNGIYGVIAAATEALGGSSAAAQDHIVACAGGDRAVLLVVPRPFRATDRHEVVKRCRKSRLEILHPLGEPKRGRRDYDERVAANESVRQAIEGAVVATDDRPFLVPPPPPGELWGALAETARSIVPNGKEPARDVKAAAPTPPEGESDVPEVAEPVPAGLAALATLVVLAVLLLGAIWPPPRSRDPGRKMPMTLRASLPFFGAALALCSFALADRLLQVAGDAAYAWPFVIPVGIVGVGAGRLFIDTLARDRSRRAVMIALAIALVWLLLLHVVGERLEGLVTKPEAVRLGLSGVLLLISGFLFGFPLAAALRFVGEWDPGPTAWCWGMHQAGWALGGAAAALLVYYVGVARLWPLGLAVFAVGAVLLTLGARAAPPAHWLVRSLR